MRRLLVALSLIAASCGSGSLDVAADAGAEPAPVPSGDSVLSGDSVPSGDSAPSTDETAAPVTVTSTSTTAAPTATVPTTTVPTTTTLYREQDYIPFADAAGVTIHLPAAQVEHIGFHQAGHDGSRQMELIDLSVRWTVLADRGRNTGTHTAADIVVAPDAEIRAPATGTVIRAGTYTLYCDHSDHFLVIDPDDHPGWEVKMFHFEGLQVAVGDHVEAGVTVVGTSARVLPFVSQVDDLTREPSNPHVHVEVIDPSIPDIPSGSSGC